jgi:hypothetical protein
MTVDFEKVAAEISAWLVELELDCSVKIERADDRAAWKGYVWSNTSHHQRLFILPDVTVASAKNPDLVRHLRFQAMHAARAVDRARRGIPDPVLT